MSYDPGTVILRKETYTFAFHALASLSTWFFVLKGDGLTGNHRPLRIRATCSSLRENEERGR